MSDAVDGRSCGKLKIALALKQHKILLVAHTPSAAYGASSLAEGAYEHIRYNVRRLIAKLYTTVKYTNAKRSTEASVERIFLIANIKIFS